MFNWHSIDSDEKYYFSKKNRRIRKHRYNLDNAKIASLIWYKKLRKR